MDNTRLRAHLRVQRKQIMEIEKYLYENSKDDGGVPTFWPLADEGYHELVLQADGRPRNWGVDDALPGDPETLEETPISDPEPEVT